MAQRKLTVFVYLPGATTAVPAGLFTHDDDLGVGSFSYGRRYLARDGAFAVDPVALPLGATAPEVVLNDGLYGAFRDAAPDYWGRLVIAAQSNVPPESLSEVDFLLAANATRVGNLDFRDSPQSPEPMLQPPHFNHLAGVMDAAKRIEAGEQTDAHLLQLLRQGSSMGGTRPKCTVEWQDSLWIAKFSAKEDSVNIPRIEFATMTLAGRCKIRIPEIRVVAVGDKDVFLVRRFDRERGASGWLRRGFLSALSLMQWDEKDRLRWDYLALADTMRRYVGKSHVAELFRRMVFNVLVRNQDDHPRNHGFVVDGADLSLSPAYDIVPGLTRAGVGTRFQLAMSLGDRGREASVANALSRASRFGLSPGEARAITEELIETTRQWRTLFGDLGVSDRDVELLTPSFLGSED